MVLVHPAGGLALALRGLVPHLDPGPAVLALQDPALSGGPGAESLADLVDAHLHNLDAEHAGPVHLVGWSFGGQLAHAMAARLGERARSLTLLDAYLLDTEPTAALPAGPEGDAEIRAAAATFVDGVGHAAELDAAARDRVLAAHVRHARWMRDAHDVVVPGLPTLLVSARRTAPDDMRARRDARWRDALPDGVEVVELDLEHTDLGGPAGLREVAGPLRDHLASIPPGP